jgi:hypothetical protein
MGLAARPARKQSQKLKNATSAPIISLAKITYTGNSIIRAFGKESSFKENVLGLCHRDILMSQIKQSVLARNSFEGVLLKSVVLTISFLFCISQRSLVDSVALSLLM